MPELPEVETVRRGLAPAMEGAQFAKVEVRHRGLRWPIAKDFEKRLKGRTVEGLGRPGSPHPLQAAFIAEQAAQCGYCTSGMLIAAAGLLAQCPHPTEADVRLALERNLCRCGSHNRVIRAVLRASGTAG